MLFLKTCLFKLLELTLGLRPYFTLQTRDPIFVNFRLSEGEAQAVRQTLPSGFTLRAIRFAASDPEPAFWISYNLYALRYPRPEMAAVRKVRCEINTFVSDAHGRLGVFVFCGSPFVSKGDGRTAIEKVADVAERLVQFLYGCGRLTHVEATFSDGSLRVALEENEAQLALEVPIPSARAPRRERLSDDYYRFNDVSFFRGGASHDLISAGSAFVLATLEEVDPSTLAGASGRTPFFQRPPDRLYIHRGDISYVVSAFHRPSSRVTV